MIKPNPLKAKCVECGSKITYHKGIYDSDFFACMCGDSDGIYKTKVIYHGWDLPIEWKLPFFYKLRLLLANMILGK